MKPIFAALLLFFVWFAPAAALPRAVVFDFELIDTSAEGDLRGKREDETKRLGLMGQTLRDALAAKRLYEVVDVSPVRAQVAKERALHDCNGCVERIAAPLGVDVAFIGYVQKVSNLILNVNVEIRDVKTGAVLKVVSADIRSNTDQSWLRGLNFLIDNRLSN
ncbi:MAG: DUF3280 domain-containing protein [Hyphomicrobiales bacterium]|nr:DUF3280 domain-containing protein [Hyphomicrobiales bacterium]